MKSDKIRDRTLNSEWIWTQRLNSVYLTSEANIQWVTAKIIQVPENVSSSKKDRVLRKQNFHGCIARNKRLVSEKNRKKRLNFTRNYLIKNFNFWRKSIFTDESKFNTFYSDNKITVWWWLNEKYKIKNFNCIVKHREQLMIVWGCIFATGMDSLEFIEGNTNKYDYTNILKTNINSENIEKMHHLL